MSQDNKNKLTPEEAATFQQYNDVTQKAHEGLTEDNNKRIRLVLTKRLFICAGIPLLFASCIIGLIIGALFFEPILLTFKPNIINEYKSEHLVSVLKYEKLKTNAETKVKNQSAKIEDQKTVIADKDLTIEKCLISHASENQELAIMRENLRHKTIGKQFYHAIANELAGEPQEKINHHLDKMFSNNHERASLIKDTWIKDALDLGAINVAELVGKRIELVKDKEKFEAIAAIKKLMKRRDSKKVIVPSWEEECSGE